MTRPATIDVDALAGEIAGALRAQVHDDVSDVARLADAPERVVLVETAKVVEAAIAGECPRQPDTHIRLDQPGRNDVHVHAVVAFFFRQRERERFERGAFGAVAGDREVGVQAAPGAQENVVPLDRRQAPDRERDGAGAVEAEVARLPVGGGAVVGDVEVLVAREAANKIL